MSASKKRQTKKIILVMPSRVEILKSVRGAPTPKGKTIKPRKGGKYNRNAERRRHKKEGEF